LTLLDSAASAPPYTYTHPNSNNTLQSHWCLCSGLWVIACTMVWVSLPVFIWMKGWV